MVTPPNTGEPGTSGTVKEQPLEFVESLYTKRKEIYPRARVGAQLGYFERWRWVFVWLTQIVYYGGPWLSWNDRQAILFDLAARKFYIFGWVLWPQDVIYLTAILVISALGLFLFTAIGGRLWCGYACPQTVYTEIFMWIERVIEGDRAKRMALDRAAHSWRKYAIKSAKHVAWIVVALWTGFTFVGYFTPIRALGADILGLSIGGWAAFWVLFYGFATYGNAGWLREQVCIYMCPYARFQSAMFDKDTLIVTYDAKRGEPRGMGTKERIERGLGDCVDCGLCVQVCPTGIDIRDGLQYECIGCAACIDACDVVMERTGQPKGLIRYATDNALHYGYTPAQIGKRILRPRTVIYGTVLGALCVGFVFALTVRVPLKVDVIRDRHALSREVIDERGRAWVENAYRLQVMNALEVPQTYTVEASGLPGLQVAQPQTIRVEGAATLSVPLRLQIDADQIDSGVHPIEIIVTSEQDPKIQVREESRLIGPRR